MGTIRLNHLDLSVAQFLDTATGEMSTRQTPAQRRRDAAVCPCVCVMKTYTWRGCRRWTAVYAKNSLLRDRGRGGSQSICATAIRCVESA